MTSPVSLQAATVRRYAPAQDPDQLALEALQTVALPEVGGGVRNVNVDRFDEGPSAYGVGGGGGKKKAHRLQHPKGKKHGVGGAAGGGSQLLDKLGGSLNGLDAQIDKLIKKGGDLSPQEQMKLQQAQQKRSELYSLVSNMMKMEHEMRMAIVGNMR